MVEPLIGRVSCKDLLDRQGTSMGPCRVKYLLIQMRAYSSDSRLVVGPFHRSQGDAAALAQGLGRAPEACCPGQRSLRRHNARQSFQTEGAEPIVVQRAGPRQTFLMEEASRGEVALERFDPSQEFERQDHVPSVPQFPAERQALLHQCTCAICIILPEHYPPRYPAVNGFSKLV